MSARKTQGCGAREASSRARAPECIERSCANALVRFPEFAGDVAIRKRKTGLKAQILSASSGCAPARPGRSRAIREEIIGHRMGLVRRLGHGGKFRHGEFAFAMLHQPARQQSRRSFLHPLINQSGNLFSQVGCVAQPGKFVTLQTVSRSREEKLPRRLGLVAGQKEPPRGKWVRIVTQE